MKTLQRFFSEGKGQSAQLYSEKVILTTKQGACRRQRPEGRLPQCQLGNSGMGTGGGDKGGEKLTWERLRRSNGQDWEISQTVLRQEGSRKRCHRTVPLLPLP